MSKSNKKKLPREIVPDDDYYMGLAFLAASRSRDPYHQEGAVIVNGFLVASSPNAIPGKIKNEDINWERSEKADYVEGAIDNVVWMADYSTLEGGTIYYTDFPCKKSIRIIVRARLARVVFFCNLTSISEYVAKERETVSNIARLGGVKLDEFKGNLNWMRDQMTKFEKVGIFE